MRLNKDYRFDIQLQEGIAAEDDFAALVGARLYEVKFDQRAVHTGNFYVEFEDNPGETGWKQSGIATSEAECWVFVLDDGTFIGIPKTKLVRLAREAFRADRIGRQLHGSCPTRGALVPVNWATRLFPD